MNKPSIIPKVYDEFIMKEEKCVKVGGPYVEM